MTDTAPATKGALSLRKEDIRRLSDRLAPERQRWLDRGAFFHREDLQYLKFLIPDGARILELGCGTGHLLAALRPSFGVGVDISEGMIGEARRSYPNLSFYVGDVENEELIRRLPGPFDVILIADTLGALEDCQALFESLHRLCTRETRLVTAYFSHLWHPVLKGAEMFGLRTPQPPQNTSLPGRRTGDRNACRFRAGQERNSVAPPGLLVRPRPVGQPFSGALAADPPCACGTTRYAVRCTISKAPSR